MGLKVGSKDLSPEQLRDFFRSQIDKAAAAGFDLQVQQVDVTLTHDVILNDVRGVLKKEQWDGVAIGFGIRGREDLTPLFEKLVNAVVGEVQPTPKFCFPLTPHTVWESFSRVYGVKE